MAESETKPHRVIESILKAVRSKSTKSGPEDAGRVLKIPKEKAPAPGKNVRAEKIITDAKHVVAEAKAKGQHVTTGLHEWAKNNKFVELDQDPAQALKIARKDLTSAIRAAKLPPDSWIAREAANVRCAEAAQALSAVALAPAEVRENPNFLFQTAAQLAVNNSNPEAQPTIKAFIAEMNNLNGTVGFDMGENELRQILTEAGMGAMPTPPSDTFPEASFATLPDNVKYVFRALNAQLHTLKPDASDSERYQILTSFSKQIEDIDSTGFSQAQQDAFSKVMMEKARLEALSAPVRGIKRERFIDKHKITPVGQGDFQSRGMTDEQVDELCARPDSDGDEGIDKYIHRLMRRIFSSARAPRSPDLQEQTEYWEIEQLWRYLFGEDKAQAKLGSLRGKWETEYQRNAINWHIIRGGSSAKDLITKYLESIPPDTMQHEQGILWVPEAITAYEQATFELAAEKRFVFDEARRWFEKESSVVVNGHNVSRLEAFGMYKDKLPPVELNEIKLKQNEASHGSYILDQDAQFNANAFDKLAKLHSTIEREYQAVLIKDPGLRAIADPGQREESFFTSYAATHTNEVKALKEAWSELTLFEKPEVYVGPRLWNTEVLNKWQGFSPLQIRAMIKLEAMLQGKGIVIKEASQDVDKTWKLARAISAATRSEVGSLRSVSLAHQLLNMPGVLISPTGLGAVGAPVQEQLGRVQNPEVFMRRFSMGGANQGQEVWANLIISRLERGELNKDKLAAKTMVRLGQNDFAPAQGEDESFGMRKARSLMLKSRRHFGMGFTEMPREPLSTSMTLFDGTSWRFEPTLEKLDEVYNNPKLFEKCGLTQDDKIDYSKRVGMGMRIALKSSDEDLPIRREAWEFIAKRTPSKLVQLVFTERTDQILKDKNLAPGSVEWERFNRVLSVVEHNLQTIDKNVLTDVDLGGTTLKGKSVDVDFNTYFTDDVFRACGVEDADIPRLRSDYFDVVHGFQKTFLERGPQWKRGPKYIDLWAANKMAITVSISDYDIKYTQWERLPADHHFRRVVSDATGHLGVEESMLAFVNKPELCVQPDMKKVLEAEAMLQGAAVTYSKKIDAERMMLTMDDAVVTYMESKDFYRWIRVVPGAKTILRQLAGIDTQKPWARVMARGVRPFLNMIANSPLFVRDSEERKVFREILNTPKIEDWPRKFAQLHLAPTIAAAGPGATTYDSFDVHKHYEELEHAGLVTDNHKLLHKMRDKHKTRFPSRFLAIGQRYWWVPLVATIAVGVIIASKEQGLDDSKSH